MKIVETVASIQKQINILEANLAEAKINDEIIKATDTMLLEKISEELHAMFCQSHSYGGSSCRYYKNRNDFEYINYYNKAKCLVIYAYKNNIACETILGLLVQLGYMK